MLFYLLFFLVEWTYFNIYNIPLLPLCSKFYFFPDIRRIFPTLIFTSVWWQTVASFQKLLPPLFCNCWILIIIIKYGYENLMLYLQIYTVVFEICLPSLINFEYVLMSIYLIWVILMWLHVLIVRFINYCGNKTYFTLIATLCSIIFNSWLRGR